MNNDYCMVLLTVGRPKVIYSLQWVYFLYSTVLINWSL